MSAQINTQIAVCVSVGLLRSSGQDGIKYAQLLLEEVCVRENGKGSEV